MKVKSESEVAQSSLTLCDPMDCSLPGSSSHGISQARVLEWVAKTLSSLGLHVLSKVTNHSETRYTRNGKNTKIIKLMVGRLQSMGSLGVGHD